MSDIPQQHPIWIIENKKHLIPNRDNKRFKEMTEQFQIEIKDLRKSETKTVKSPVFQFRKLAQSFWYLTIEPNLKERDSNSGHYFGVFLHQKIDCFERFSGQFAKFQISLNNTKSRRVLTKKSKQLFFGCGSGWGWKHFIQRDQLITEESSHCLNLSLSLSITCCQWNICVNNSVQNLCSGDDPNLRSDRFAFNHDYMNDREGCDIRFTVDGSDFEAHSRLLVTKSSVFKKLMSDQNVIPIEGMDDIVFYELISFLYKGYSNNIERHCKPLLMAANDYGIPELKTICDNLCFRDLTPEEAIDALVFAYKHKTFSAKLRTLSYIAANNELIIHSNQLKWKQFIKEYSKLLAKIEELVEMKCECSQH